VLTKMCKMQEPIPWLETKKQTNAQIYNCTNARVSIVMCMYVGSSKWDCFFLHLHLLLSTVVLGSHASAEVPINSLAIIPPLAKQAQSTDKDGVSLRS
jgi:hypothetical protein